MNIDKALQFLRQKNVPDAHQFDEALVKYIAELMTEYLANNIELKQPVIKSVCICGSEEPYKPSKSAKGYEYCPKCYISRQMQTVL